MKGSSKWAQELNASVRSHLTCIKEIVGQQYLYIDASNGVLDVCLVAKHVTSNGHYF